MSIHGAKLGLVVGVAVPYLWLLLALGGWRFVKYQQEIPGVRHVDLVLPSRWPHFRLSQGNHYIADAQVVLHQGDVAAALTKLRFGVSKAPANPKGRILLANIYLANRCPGLAARHP